MINLEAIMHQLNERNLLDIRKSINTYSEGGHPAPDGKTLPYFKVGFAIKMLRMAQKDGHPVDDTIKLLMDAQRRSRTKITMSPDPRMKSAAERRAYNQELVARLKEIVVQHDNGLIMDIELLTLAGALGRTAAPLLEGELDLNTGLRMVINNTEVKNVR